MNFAGLCVALLYGQGDYRRTVQIATLFGWDSDNATATLGGLIGFMLGYDSLVAQFAPRTFSDRFDIDRTRDNMPDRLPADAAAQDTFTMMAGRMRLVTERSIVASGGLTHPGRLWLVPPPTRWGAGGDQLAWNPVNGPMSDDARSATLRVRRVGGVVASACSVNSSPPGGQGATSNPAAMSNGTEQDFSGGETPDAAKNFYSSQGPVPPGGVVTLTTTYDRPVRVHTVRIIEGDHFNSPGQIGGWFESLSVELRIGGVWVAPPGGVASQAALSAAVPFQVLDLVLATPTDATGVRVTGVAGGAQQFVTCAELDALSEPPTLAWPTFDVTDDGRVDVEDVYRQNRSPVDVNRDGMIDERDLSYLETAARWGELVPPTR